MTRTVCSGQAGTLKDRRLAGIGRQHGAALCRIA